MARRKLRELPVDIASLGRRAEGLRQDILTATRHGNDPITIGTRHYAREEVQEALGVRLKTLPLLVPQCITEGSQP